MLLGTLIHYNSPALSDLYFVDPQWLYDLLASVVTMDYGSSCVWDRGHVLFIIIAWQCFYLWQILIWWSPEF